MPRMQVDSRVRVITLLRLGYPLAQIVDRLDEEDIQV